MAELKRGQQGPGGVPVGDTPKGDPGEDNRGAEFGTRERATRGTDRDADRSGRSKNQGHGHPREERGGGAG
jgi:hypothetical protein